MIGGSQRKPGNTVGSSKSSEDEIKKENTAIGISRRDTPNQKTTVSPSRSRPQQQPTEQLRESQQLVAIEYKNKVVQLGYTWKDISAALDQKLPDRKLAASIRLCVLKRFKHRITVEQQQQAMQKYKQAMYHDT